jgi:hypothetical protein
MSPTKSMRPYPVDPVNPCEFPFVSLCLWVFVLIRWLTLNGMAGDQGETAMLPKSPCF